MIYNIEKHYQKNMENEYLDIVDENNNLIGKNELRSIAHSKGLRHRTVHIYLFRKRDDIEFLIHRRPKTKDLHPNKLATVFGGHVQSRKTIEETALLELKEETGLNVEIIDLIRGPWLKSEDILNNKEFNAVFYFEYNGKIENLKFQTSEIQEPKWLPVSKIKKSMVENPDIWMRDAKEFRKIVKFLVQKLEKQK